MPLSQHRRFGHAVSDVLDLMTWRPAGIGIVKLRVGAGRGQVENIHIAPGRLGGRTDRDAFG